MVVYIHIQFWNFHSVIQGFVKYCNSNIRQPSYTSDLKKPDVRKGFSELIKRLIDKNICRNALRIAIIWPLLIKHRNKRLATSEIVLILVFFERFLASRPRLAISPSLLNGKEALSQFFHIEYRLKHWVVRLYHFQDFSYVFGFFCHNEQIHPRIDVLHFLISLFSNCFIRSRKKFSFLDHFVIIKLLFPRTKFI